MDYDSRENRIQNLQVAIRGSFEADVKLMMYGMAVTSQSMSESFRTMAEGLVDKIEPLRPFSFVWELCEGPRLACSFKYSD